jgi:Flp pilus assembly protein TadD
MNKHQLLVVLGSVLVTIILYFGCGHVPKEKLNNEAKKQDDKSEVVFLSLKEQAKSRLDKQQNENLENLEKVLNNTKNDSTKVETLKQMASFWYQSGVLPVSAYYAEKVSESTNTGEAWQITGSSYRIALVGSKEENLKELFSQKAIHAFEKAIAIDSTNANYQMQLAMVYVEKPLQDNPMKGILLLRELNTKFPKNADIEIQLGKLAIQTGQFDKAIARFLKAIELSPGTLSINCLLAEAYHGKGDEAKANEVIKKCNK